MNPAPPVTTLNIVSIIGRRPYTSTAMYLGIDHGTTAMRFATESGAFKLSRPDACAFESRRARAARPARVD